MKIGVLKKMMICFAILSMMVGCAEKTEEAKETVEALETKETQIMMSEESPLYKVNPETFELEISNGNVYIPVSAPVENRRVEGLTETDGDMTWSYPEAKVKVSLEKQKGYLGVSITSDTDGDNEFAWPQVWGDTYYLPLGEGKRIPNDDITWMNYLSSHEFQIMEQFSMPFWAVAQGEYAVLFILENPFRSTLSFPKGHKIHFTLSHEYPSIDSEKENSFRIYVTENSPAAVAKIYRNYVIEKGNFVTLEEKAKTNPNIKKLYGAPHIYMAGEHVMATEDINWEEFRRFLPTNAMKDILAAASQVETGAEMITTVEEMTLQNYVSQYQKNVVCRFFSEIIMLGDAEEIKNSKEALASSMPGVFMPVDTWMNKKTVDIIKGLKASGIEGAWIGLNNWEQAYAKPELVSTALQQGYLIGPYDSYHSIHKPGEVRWNTASFPDIGIYDTATISNKEGEKITGFQNVGRKLNPSLSLPLVKARVDNILSMGVEFNSWFIDCDATGEIYDDYSVEHITTQQQDVESRLKRMALIRDDYNMVIGSEGGHDFAANTIAFAHGIEMKSFSWMDQDMKEHKESEYYIGKYYNSEGGVAEHFSKRIPIKEDLYTLFVNPSYDLPLFKLVYNDSVITTYHWDWSTFKIIGAVNDRMLREVLYNVPPLYHLDNVQWERYKTDIISHTKVWSDFSKQAITEEMTDFQNLKEDGSVQRCDYGDALWVVANFGDEAYLYGNESVPAHGLLINMNEKIFTYMPEISLENQ